GTVLLEGVDRPEEEGVAAAIGRAVEPSVRRLDQSRIWLRLKPEDFLFPSRLHDSPHLGTRQYARILGTGSTNWAWTAPTTERTRCDGRRRRESTVRYLGIEVDDAFEISEQTEI